MDLEFDTHRSAVYAFFALTDRGVPALYLPDACRTAPEPNATEVLVPAVRVPDALLTRALALLRACGQALPVAARPSPTQH